MHDLHSFRCLLLFFYDGEKCKQQVKCQVWQVCDFILPLVPSDLCKQRENNQLEEMCNKMALILLAPSPPFNIRLAIAIAQSA